MIIYKRKRGFTLIEILIALFVFSFLSLMVSMALHQMIKTLSKTEDSASRIRDLQLALLIFSRDVEQTIERPVRNPQGKDDPAFVGDKNKITFTHFQSSGLQRTTYWFNKHALYKSNTKVLDAVKYEKPIWNKLLTNIDQAEFEFVDQNGHLYDAWPSNHRDQKSLPKAIKFKLALTDWGNLQQIYIIMSEPKEQKTNAQDEIESSEN